MRIWFARLAALTLCAWLTACGGGDKPWHATDITGSMPKLQFRMQRANDADIVSEQNYRGRVVLLYFGYTHCPDICPATLANISAMLDRLDTQAYDVAVLFVTVDPDRDTQPVLAKYVHGFARQVEGLSGPPNGLLALTRRYRVLYKASKDSLGHPYTVMHSNSVFIFDRANSARLVTTDTGDVKALTEDIKRLLSSN